MVIKRVWYKIGDAQSTNVRVDDESKSVECTYYIDDLKKQIRSENPSLSSVDPGDIYLFEFSRVDTANVNKKDDNKDNALNPGDPIPENTTSKNPLIVRVMIQEDSSRKRTKTLLSAATLIKKDIFEFTNRLGILRLHTQKLGACLADKHPFLQGARL